MSNSLQSADRNTHIKIVALAIVAATAVVGVGLHAKGTDTVSMASRGGPVLKAGQSAAYSSNELYRIR